LIGNPEALYPAEMLSGALGIDTNTLLVPRGAHRQFQIANEVLGRIDEATFLLQIGAAGTAQVHFAARHRRRAAAAAGALQNQRVRTRVPRLPGCARA